ncbi:MAG: translation initiation factor IF-2 [Chloroflexota bacterium]|nr:translation initiation factor IF-2 [Chloroflexota bacterium]
MAEEPQRSATATRRVTLRALPIGEAVAVGVLAERMRVEPVQVIKQLMRGGVFASINQNIDFETASAVARVFGYAARKVEDAVSAAGGSVAEEDSADLETRPAVVTVLGHVDHGKTTLLDAIRRTNVVAREAGGITQHIGAYQVVHNGTPITFIDTPGHEAFTAMRARGAQVTDIAVLVVAADDGVMPQTVEAIDHIKAADVPIIVAINKMDSANADAERVRRQLSEREFVVEKWGGDVIDVEVSARQGDGIDDLLESIELVAEVAELKANPRRPGVGVVVEAQLNRNRGVLARVLVQTGTLRVGDHIVVGSTRGRVKALVNAEGKRTHNAGPSTPVEVLGLSELPGAGDRLVVVPDEKTARSTVAERLRREDLNRARGATLEEIGARISAGQAKELRLILKTDVQGSVAAVKQALEQLSTTEAQIRLIHTGTGAVTESDVMLAVASDAIIVGFNVRPDQGAQRLADQDNVQIRRYDIIYRLTEDVEKALHGLLEPTIEDVTEGSAEVRAVFSLGRNRRSAGCYVTDGRLTRGARGRVIRGGEVIFDGPIAGLRRFKDDVREVATGYECGVSLEGFNDFAEGDVIESHRQQRA